MATPTTEDWIEERILHFLNRARKVEDITNLKDPDGGYLIGETVAQRILDHKKDLDRRRYSSLAQVDAIPGVGEDKLQDLIDAFSQPADDFFVERLFDGILLDNWEIAPVQMSFEDAELFIAVTQNESNFRKAVTQLIQTAEEKSDPHTEILLRQAYLESFPESHLASFQFAYWFYLFDQDNWFSYDTIREAIEHYLAYHVVPATGLEYRQLKLYNRSPNNEITRGEIIPIIVNHSERLLTYWKVQLND
jgi:hypothetical protein